MDKGREATITETTKAIRARLVAQDSALVTYFAHITLPNDNAEYPMAVGEFWVKRTGEWFIRGYSGTLIR